MHSCCVPMHRSGVAVQQLRSCGTFLPQFLQASAHSRCSITTVQRQSRPLVLPERSRTELSRSRISHTIVPRRLPTFTVLSQPETDQITGGEVETADIEAMDEDELDQLFEEYGQVVIANSTDRVPTSDVDNDSESLGFAIAMAQAADEVKAGDIKVLFVKPLIYWTRFFVLATGFSKPQVGAIADKMQEVAQGFDRQPRGDLTPNAWTLLDFGDVVVHLFQPKERAYYNLEEFYGNAPCVELPFPSQAAK